MGLAIYAIAAVAAALVTSVVLWYKHGLVPVGSNEMPAAKWWLAIIALDGAVAAVLLSGSLALASLDQLSNFGDWARAIAIGILGPLGVRSPIREVNLGGKKEGVGITVAYDKVWHFFDRRLDGDITVYRREERKLIIEDLERVQWTPQALAAELSEYVDELSSREGEEKKAICAKVESALTLPSATKQFGALIKVMRDERLNSILATVRNQGPESN